MGVWGVRGGLGGDGDLDWSSSREERGGTWEGGGGGGRCFLWVSDLSIVGENGCAVVGGGGGREGGGGGGGGGVGRRCCLVESILSLVQEGEDFGYGAGPLGWRVEVIMVGSVFRERNGRADISVL